MGPRLVRVGREMLFKQWNRLVVAPHQNVRGSNEIGINSGRVGSMRLSFSTARTASSSLLAAVKASASSM
jgi:hypothetical protein